MSNGDSLSGTIVERTEQTIVLDHAVLGRIEIPADQVVESEPVDDESEARKPGVFGTRFLAGWDRSVSLGFSGSQGNSVETSLNTRLNASYEDEHDRWKFDSTYFFATADGETETNEVFVQLRKDWRFAESAWFPFVEGRYDFDEFQAWDHRATGSTGFGYEFIMSDTWEVIGRVGGGASKTFGDESETVPETVVSLEVSWRLTDGQVIETANTIYPDVADLGEFRTISSLDWSIDISAELDLRLKLGVLNEYDSNTEGKNNDLKYTGSLVYDF